MKEVTRWYAVEFEWKEEFGLPSEDEFFPVTLYQLHELAEMLEEHFRCAEIEECPYEIVTIRPATNYEIESCPRYYGYC